MSLVAGLRSGFFILSLPNTPPSRSEEEEEEEEEEAGGGRVTLPRGMVATWEEREEEDVGDGPWANDAVPLVGSN